MRFLVKAVAASALLASAVIGQSTLTDFNPVKADIKALLTNEQPFWPFDTVKSYGPLFVRLAWHCSGSYRIYDGRGGCDGARQRFEPERSWADNTNLDKARHLLQNIKTKYGDQLSWGDLIVLAGTTAIEAMGGPVLGFCGGRIDDMDGTASLKLGPSVDQQAYAPCAVNGTCTSPLGTTTVGLIYVNPAGPLGVPDPAGSAPQVRDTFGRMNMNDSETVALIGGGHAFGKTHGACPLGAGDAPNVAPANPWPGNCGTGANKGKGVNAYTSGFEGPWTDTPTQWGNQYFNLLVNYRDKWNVITGPGGNPQWTNNVTQTMMLTTDISLINDTLYWPIVQEFSSNLTALNVAFSHAWYKLVSRDMGPVTRCTGNLVPPAQNFQFPLPATPSPLADFTVVKSLITSAWNSTIRTQLIHLAYRCAATFRQTDYLGGCNGARIRLSPENTWTVNNGTADIISWLNTSVMHKYTTGGALSFSDLIVLAGQAAVEYDTGMSLTFCPGRVDTNDSGPSTLLAPKTYNDSDAITTIMMVRDAQQLSGLTPHQYIALQGRPRLAALQMKQGYSGTWGTTSTFTNTYFQTLLNNSWTMQNSSASRVEYVNGSIYMTPEDLALIWDAEYLAIVQEFAGNSSSFITEFTSAWTTLMNADRFNGPTGSVCDNIAQFVSVAPATSGPYTYHTDRVAQDPGIWIFLSVGLVVIFGFLYIRSTDGHFPGCEKD